MEFRKEIVKAVAKTGVGESLANEILERPQNREMGDYALPCFKLAKEMEKNPMDIANEIAGKITLPKEFNTVQVKGAYINFFVNYEVLSTQVVRQILKEKEKYGFAKKKSTKKIIVEYCQANPLKAFHIGHVRNICTGETIAKLLEASGEKIIRVDYGGDVGTHVSKTLYAYRNLEHAPEPKNIIEKEKWLGDLYTLGASTVKENPQLEEKMREMVIALEKKSDKQLVSDWKYLRKTSMQCFVRIFKELNVKFDKIILESEVEKEGIKIAKQLYKKGFAIKDDRAILVDLTAHGLEKLLILKSDGAALYSSKDLALAKLKKTKMKAEKSYNVVGAEQSFYFNQLIKIFELLNEKKKEYCETEHISYELVRLEGGKMSSREGNVITYTELFKKIFEKTLNETVQRHSMWKKEKISKTASSIALGAIKFGMLSQDRNKVITFNWERAISLEGETGPFVQYSFARAKSILRKAGKFKTPKKILVGHENEKNLISLLSTYKEELESAIQAKAPHKIAHYLLKLSSTFNSFYQQVPVLQTEKNEKDSRLSLVRATTIVLENGLNILNIDPVEQM